MRSLDIRYALISIFVIIVLGIIAVTLYRASTVRASKDAGNCGNLQSECSFFESLQPILGSTKSIRVFKLAQPCNQCNKPAYFVDFPKTLLNAEDAKFFLEKFSEPSSYILNLQKAMPFFADYGFLLEGADGPVILLLSSFSQSVRLVRDGSDRVLIGNIDPIFPEVRARLESIR
jgi:hypothetical protein